MPTANENPFDVATSSPTSPGLVSSANPALGGQTDPQTNQTTSNTSGQTPAPAPSPWSPSAGYTAPQATAPAPGTVANATTRDATASQAAVSQGQGTMVNVDPDKQTVEGRIAAITSKTSPLFQQAMARAAQQMAQRGLVNSTMGTTAAESAVLGAALPIAQQDASTYQNTALANADIANQFEAANVNARNQGAQFNAQQQTAVDVSNSTEANAASRQNAQSANQMSLANLDARSRLQLQSLDADTRVGLANIEANFKTLMQASQSASDLYRQTIDAMSQITMNPNLNAEAKQAALTQQTQLLQNGMQIIGAMNNLNIGSLLDFSNITTTPGGTVGSPGAPSPAPAPAFPQPGIPRYDGTFGPNLESPYGNNGS